MVLRFLKDEYMELATLDEPTALAIPVPATVRPTVKELISAFTLEMDVRHSSRITYKRNLHQYFNWIEQNQIPLDSVTRAVIIRYKEDLLNRGLGALTVGSYLVAVKLFYTWAEAHKLYPNVAAGINPPKKNKQFKKMHLTLQQMIDLLAYFAKKITDSEGDKKVGEIRNFAIVNLLARTGIREIEAVESKIENISSRNGKRILTIRSKGKNDCEDFVVLTDKAYNPISEYLSLRKDALNGSPLFISSSNNNKNNRLNTSHIRKIVRAGLDAIGLTSGGRYSTHSLRHSVAIFIIRQSDTEHAQWVLRHANYATTLIYTESIKDEWRLDNPPEELIDNLF